MVLMLVSNHRIYSGAFRQPELPRQFRVGHSANTALTATHAVMKLWENLLASAVEPWVSYIALSTKLMLLQHEAHSTPNKS